MKSWLQEIGNQIADGLRRMSLAINHKHGPSEIIGFALGTDDEVVYAETFFLISPTAINSLCDWPKEIYDWRGWGANIDGEYFEDECRSFGATWEMVYGDESQRNERYKIDEDSCTERFKVLEYSLLQCRNDGTFNRNTLLFCGSVDPSKHMSKLEVEACTRLNSIAVAEYFFRNTNLTNYIPRDSNQ